ncbi:MAG: DUF4259 domain-containing protein [Candidatus Thiodiazotropha lotti]
MGAWSHEPFGNDDANDWAYGLEGFVDLSLIEKTLDRALEAEKYLEAPKALEAVAAVEVLAKLLGKGTQTDTYTEKVFEFLDPIEDSLDLHPVPFALIDGCSTLPSSLRIRYIFTH